jgi:hypothetical protein
MFIECNQGEIIWIKSISFATVQVGISLKLLVRISIVKKHPDNDTIPPHKEDSENRLTNECSTIMAASE